MQECEILKYFIGRFTVNKRSKCIRVYTGLSFSLKIENINAFRYIIAERKKIGRQNSAKNA